jgi:hypothetical protein
MAGANFEIAARKQQQQKRKTQFTFDVNSKLGRGPRSYTG